MNQNNTKKIQKIKIFKQVIKDICNDIYNFFKDEIDEEVIAMTGVIAIMSGLFLILMPLLIGFGNKINIIIGCILISPFGVILIFKLYFFLHDYIQQEINIAKNKLSK